MRTLILSKFNRPLPNWQPRLSTLQVQLHVIQALRHYHLPLSALGVYLIELSSAYRALNQNSMYICMYDVYLMWYNNVTHDFAIMMTISRFDHTHTHTYKSIKEILY